MNPNLTFFDFQGKRIFSLEVPGYGFLHFCDKVFYDNVSDALRFIKGEVNPVIAAMEEEQVAPFNEFIKEHAENIEIQGDVSVPEHDALEE